MIGCTAACWTETQCPVCRRPQSPRGRSVPLAAANGYCDGHECAGRTQRHLWDEHDEARWYVDPDGWNAHVASCAQCREVNE